MIILAILNALFILLFNIFFIEKVLDAYSQSNYASMSYIFILLAIIDILSICITLYNNKIWVKYLYPAEILIFLFLSMTHSNEKPNNLYEKWRDDAIFAPIEISNNKILSGDETIKNYVELNIFGSNNPMICEINSHFIGNFDNLKLKPLSERAFSTRDGDNFSKDEIIKILKTTKSRFSGNIIKERDFNISFPFIFFCDNALCSNIKIDHYDDIEFIVTDSKTNQNECVKQIEANCTIIKRYGIDLKELGKDSKYTNKIKVLENQKIIFNFLNKGDQ